MGLMKIQPRPKAGWFVGENLGIRRGKRAPGSEHISALTWETIPSKETHFDWINL